MAPTIEKSISRALRMVHDGIMVVWNNALERFQVLYKDKRSGITRIVMTVEEDDGAYRPVDMRTVLYLQNYVAWDLLDQFPNPKDLARYMSEKKDYRKMKREEYRTEYRKWWNREHKTEWKHAIENFKRGIVSIPEEKKRKIIVHA